MTQDEAFKAWWYSEGSQPPYTHHDCEEHTMRMCEIAWANGAYKAIAELESQEPVAWIWKDMRGQEIVSLFEPRLNSVPLYTQPPQRTWVGLTDEEIIDVIHPLVMADMPDEATDYEIAQAIESKLKEKNT